MARLAPAKSNSQSRQRVRYELTVNTFDRTATLLIALLILGGAYVVGLGIVFFANKFDQPVQAIEFVPVEASSPNANMGLADEPDPPGLEEAAELLEPQLMDTLDALTTMSLSDSILSDEVFDAEQEASKGKGLGDARRAGPGGDGVVERVPRWERWKIRFEPNSREDFAAWLDQYKVRVGVLGSDNMVHFAYSFTSDAPRTESVTSLEARKWKESLPADGPMPALTRELAANAGIAGRGPLALLFFPFEVEALLYTLEKKENPSGDANDIRETVFTVERSGDGFSFKVISQRYF